MKINTLKSLTLGILLLRILSAVADAASIAADNASNSPYQPSGVWASGQNGGYGLGAWSLNHPGAAAGEYIGDSGVGTSPTWGVYAGNNAGIR